MTKWYFKPIAVVIAIFAVGPLALPLILKSPELSRRNKILLILLTVLVTAAAIKTAIDLYTLLRERMEELQRTLNY